MVVAIVLVLGMALIVYARTSRPAADASEPRVYTGTTGNHWHGAYGFQICSDTPNIQLAGDLEEKDASGNFISQAMRTTGIHSHGDGVIHWHAWTSRASGRNAKLDIFFDNYDVELGDEVLELPEGDDDRLSRLIFPGGAPDNPADFPLRYEEDETECAGEDATLKVVVWKDYTDPDSQQVYTSNFGDIPFDQDGLVIVVAFVPDDVEVEMPSWAPNLPSLGAADAGSAQVPTSEVASGSDASATTDASPRSESESTEPDGTASESTDSESTESASESTEQSADTESADSTES
jgi:hypothetical protein